MKVMRKILWLVILAFSLMKTSNAFGNVWVYGNVYEQDYVTPIEHATVTFSGVDVAGDTLVYHLVTDSLGYYSDTINEGMYWIWAEAEGYAPDYLMDSLYVEEWLFGLEFYLHEVYEPVRYVAARQFTNDLVRISWSMHDPQLYESFETGDFSQFNWNNTLSDYPWVIDSNHAYEGAYCMRSSCQGQGNGVSQIEVSVYIPMAGQMSFFSKISSESSWDMGRFYLDGVKKMECSGEEGWTEHRFDVTVGEHVFRWTYQKDASTDMGDDCFYVDAIRFYQEETKTSRSFQYYDLFRSRFEEEPVMMASHLIDTVFMEMNWNSLPWGQYRWGVSCYYEGNRGNSDTVWSAYLDKAMTTTFEINATTNIGLPPSGAVVTLSSQEGHAYQAALDANGHLLLPDVYRDSYDLRVHLDGFVDYVSDSALSIFEPTQVEIELLEAMNGIDSLYVSSTGWAMWSLETPRSRDLQHYEIMLNGEPVGTSTTNAFQFDVSHLIEGEAYQAQVRPVYVSGPCDWQAYTWTYRSCSDFPGSTMGLTWSLHNEALQLSWTNPEGEVLGAFLYRDGDLLGFTDGESFVDETVTMHGEVEYCLRLVYGGALDGTYYSMSCEECVTAVFTAYCDPPVKLDGTVYYENESDHGALIMWGERPDPIEQWLQYDNGIYKSALGGDGEPRIFWAIRFGAEDLAEYPGTALKKVSLYDVAAGTYQLWVYVGGETSPRTLVRSQSMTLSGTQAWHEETIAPAFEIPENESLWVVIGQQGAARPAAACQDMGNPDGRWVSLDGETWTDMHTFNMHYTWMLRAFVTNQARREMALGREGYILQQYNLYRSFDNADYEQVAAIPAVEGQLYYEYRDNLFDDTHEYVYYRLTAFYLADDGETCESDYATTLDDPTQNHVVIDLMATDEHHAASLQLYPNPTNGCITIEQEGMQKVMVYNAMGQVLLNKETSSDVLQLDLSSFENGLYWIKVLAQNGTAVRSFVISR